MEVTIRISNGGGELLTPILSAVAGVTLATVDSNSVLPKIHFNVATVLATLGFGLVTWFAQGVDFPNSNRRFARLI